MIFSLDREEALKSRRNPHAIWSKASERLDPEVTPALNPRFQIETGAKIFTIGSCFARNIEEHVARLGFDIPMLRFTVPNEEWQFRPAGILNKYTPASIFQEIDWTARVHRAGGTVTPELCAPFRYDCEKGVIDTNIDGFVPVTEERFLQRRKDIYDVFKEVFESDCVIITLGLIEAWYDTENDVFIQAAPVGRNFKNADQFEFRVLGYAESLDFIDRSIALVRDVNPNARFMITTSPVGLNRTFANNDVIIENTFSKALLRTVCGELYYKYDFLDYFPSFESVFLTKSWDIWHTDKRHVTDRYVGKIVGRLVGAYFQGVDANKLLFQKSYTEGMGGDIDAALEIAEQLRADYAEDPEFLYHYATLLVKRNRLEEAEEHQRKAMDLDPGKAMHHRFLGMVLARQRRVQEAIDEAAKAVEIDPTEHRYLSFHGEMLFRGNRLEEAEQAQRQALRLNPNFSVGLWRLATVLAKKGKPGEALIMARRAVETDPNNEDARALRDELEDVVNGNRASPAAQDRASHPAQPPEPPPTETKTGLVERVRTALGGLFG